MGTVVVGKVESGIVRKGQTVLVMPNKVSERTINLYFVNNNFTCMLIYIFINNSDQWKWHQSITN